MLSIRQHLTDRVHLFLPALYGAVILLAASAGALVLVRHQGVGIGGDEPYYFVEAVSIGRFHTINLNPGYNFAITHHVIFPWKAHPGPHLAAQIGQGTPRYRDGLVLPGHAIGLSALLAIPMLAGTGMAVAALLVILALLAIGLAHLVGEVVEFTSRWRIAIVGLVLAPAYLLAATQFYPDLITGLVIAILIMLLALIERRGTLTSLQVAAGSSLLAFLPWLDAKNILLQPVFMLVILIVYFRTRLPTDQLLWLVIPPIISLACLVGFNIWGFGYPFGDRQPISLLGLNTLTRFVALLFDRRQGLIVQFPVSLLGIAGIWVSRRRNPLACLTAVVMILGLAYGNATQEISFGGGSLVGRFEWPDMPVLFAFAGMYLLELWKIRPRAVKTLAVLIGVIYVLQAAPILLDEHLYFNQLAWDPSRYSGWWPAAGLDPSPVLGYLGSVAHWPVTVSNVVGVSSDGATSIVGAIPGIDWWLSSRTCLGLVWLVASGATAVYFLLALLRRPTKYNRKILGSLLALSVLTGLATLVTQDLLPAPITFTASSYFSSSPTRGTSRVLTGPMSPPVLGPYWTLLPGSYEATINYRVLTGTGKATLAVFAVTGDSHARNVRLGAIPLPNTSNSDRITFEVRTSEQITFRALWVGLGSFEMRSITLTKGGSP